MDQFILNMDIPAECDGNRWAGFAGAGIIPVVDPDQRAIIPIKIELISKFRAVATAAVAEAAPGARNVIVLFPMSEAAMGRKRLSPAP